VKIGEHRVRIAYQHTDATVPHHSSHMWAADDVYTLTFNAGPQQWNGHQDRSMIASLLQADGTVLWCQTFEWPKYDDFNGNLWTED